MDHRAEGGAGLGCVSCGKGGLCVNDLVRKACAGSDTGHGDQQVCKLLRDSCSAPAPRLALTAMEAPQALGVSHDFFREHIASELRWVRRGRKKLVSVRELERWLDENGGRVFGQST